MIADILHLDIENPFRQKTFRGSIHAIGIGIHSGMNAKITFHPAPVGTGIVFRRVDVTDKNNEIKASYENVVDTRMCSCFGNKEGVVIGTTEHLMAALNAYGISNAYIDVTGPEVPMMDGSAKAFAFLFDCVGVVEQEEVLKAVVIKKKVSFTDDKGVTVSLSPEKEDFIMDFSIDFPARAIGHQECSFKLSQKAFKEEIAYARTFGNLQEAEALRKMGLGLGASLENAVVVDGDRIVNPEGLRDQKEFVRHKMLDAIGDLYQAGMPIIGHFKGEKSGHYHNNMLLRELFKDSSNYEIVDLNEYYKKMNIHTVAVA